MKLRTIQRSTRFLVIAAALFTTAAAHSQDNASSDTKWEIELHAGTLASYSGGGESGLKLPDPGQTFVPAPALFPGATTRRVSSWFFGDGTAPYDAAFPPGAFPESSRIKPLDSALTPSAIHFGSGQFGFRISRRALTWLDTEFSMDLGPERMPTDETVAVAEASLVSFQTAWLNSVSFTATRSFFETKSGRSLFIAGAGVVNLPRTVNRFNPFLVAGLGSRRDLGRDPRIVLIGAYSSPGGVAQEDAVLVQYERKRDSNLTGILGGGAKVFITSRSGVRVEARIHLYKNPVIASITTQPVAHTSVRAVIFNPGPGVPPFASGSDESFSDNSLTGSGLRNFETSSETGIQRELYITAGYFVRF